MPRLVYALPAYKRHRASGQAVTTLAGQTYYLGPYATEFSRNRYQQLIEAWSRAGRPRSFVAPWVTPETLSSPANSSGSEPGTVSLTPGEAPTVGKVSALAATSAHSEPKDEVPLGKRLVLELVAAFWDYAPRRYSRHGESTGTHLNYHPVLKLLNERYGEVPVGSFGPKMLKRLQEELRQLGHSRRYINDNIDRIRRVFTWGVSEEMVPPNVVAMLETVENISEGSAGVVEHPPVEPVSDATVEATLKFLPPVIADMVRVQLLTGCRPGEICMMRPQDVDRSDAIWVYRPRKHKTEHHGKQRRIVIGPQAQDVLRNYLSGAPDQPCFSPAASEQRRSGERRRQRKTPITPAQAARKPNPTRKSKPGNAYTNDSYRRAITRACDRAFPPPKKLSRIALQKWREGHRWSPNQLRHAAATKICNHEEALLGAQIILGHASVRTTETYAKPSLELAKRVISQLG